MKESNYFPTDGMTDEEIDWLNDYCETVENYGNWPSPN